MTNNKGTRLQYARRKLGVTQADIARIWKLSGNVGVSKRERGVTDISYEEAVALETSFGINANWLMTGEGEWRVNDFSVVAEPGVVYNTIDTSEGAIHQRFLHEIELRAREQRLLAKEVAGRLGVSDSHWSQVKRGDKGITIGMLASAVAELHVDAHFVLAAKDSRGINMQIELTELRADNNRLKLLISLLEQQMEKSGGQKKSA